MNKLNIAVITDCPFPYGMADANRIISYSKGLVELDNSVTVLTSYYGEKLDGFLDFKGIKYKTFRIRRKIGLLNKIGFVFSVFRMLVFLWQKIKSFNVVLLVSNNAAVIVLTYLICKTKGIKYVQEKSEFPFVLNNKSLPGRLYAQIYVRNIYRLFDGMIIMTNPLFEYFRTKTHKDCKKIIVPMTVEPERFEKIDAANPLGQYIAYCGYMGGNKDGVENLIRSFSLIENKFPLLKLVLIGSAKEAELNDLKRIVNELNLKNVVFYGSVSREKIPALLCNAQILALARPSSLQSQGGFPTKLGEYLSTGKPVIVTAVGEIPHYLNDGVNAFVVKPDDNEAFAHKLEYILNNYEHALEIARSGKELTSTVFNYKVQSKRIQDFFIELIFNSPIETQRKTFK